jgi:hypothetical protein
VFWPRPPATVVVVAALAVTLGDDEPHAAVATTSSSPPATSEVVANQPGPDPERERFDIECFLSVGMTRATVDHPAEQAFNKG